MRKPLLAGSKLPELWVVEQFEVTPSRRHGLTKGKITWIEVTDPAAFSLAEKSRQELTLAFNRNYRIVAAKETS